MIERTDAVNWSTLRYMRESPKHYRHYLANPPEDTDARLLGRLVHCMVYEPTTLDARYVLEPKFHRGMKDATAIDKGYVGGREAAEAWDASVANSGADVVRPDLYLRAMGCRDALLGDHVAAPMIRGGFAEQPITWTDPETGIECRGRVDHVNGCLSDLKTTRSVAQRLFARDVASYGYNAQLAYYADGLAANGIMLVEPPCLIAVESEAPHDVVVLELDSDALDAGRAIYRECLRVLSECRAVDDWPGVGGNVRHRLMLPAWAMPAEEPVTLGGVPAF